MLPPDLISIKDAATIFGVAPVILHRAKLRGEFKAWKRELGRHYASMEELQIWWAVASLVKPKHKDKQPRKCRGFEVLDEVVYNPDKPREKIKLGPRPEK